MNAAFIPVRGGSKSIPLKNIKPIMGRPLVYWTVKAACESHNIDTVYIATDSEQIKLVVEKIRKEEPEECFSKIRVIGRSEESASDTASTEFAMLEFANQYMFDNIILIQATSPMLTSEDIDRGFDVFKDADSVLSVVRQKRFLWNRDENGIARPTNYDVFHRPRRQEFDGYLVENGAFYITSRKLLLDSGNRVSGRIKAVEMDEDTFFEIDEISDWVIIEALMKKRGYATDDPIPEIKLFLTDCDGCLTDGGMYYSELGDELKKFNTRDGMAFSLLKKRGILTGIITGESVELNRRRAQKLHLDFLESGCQDKLSAIKRISETCGIDLANTCYIGDDLNDIEAIKAVGFGCCPADAMEEVQEEADYIAKSKGGSGVIREICRLILDEE